MGRHNHLLANDDFQKVALFEHDLFLEKRCKRTKMGGIWKLHFTVSTTAAVALAMRDATKKRESCMMSELVKFGSW